MSVPPTKLPSTSHENVAVPCPADILFTVYTPVVEFILTSTPDSEATEKTVFAFVVMSVFPKNTLNVPPAPLKLDTTPSLSATAV